MTVWSKIDETAMTRRHRALLYEEHRPQNYVRVYIYLKVIKNFKKIENLESTVVCYAKEGSSDGICKMKKHRM